MSHVEKEINSSDENTELSLVNSWSESLSRDDLVPTIADVSEAALDTIFDDGLIKEIPVISNFIAMYKIGNSIKERHHMKKLVEFLDELRKGIDEKTRQEYIQRITKNKRTTQRELEYLLILLDRMISERKVKFLAKIYLAYLRNEIDWTIFCKLSEVVDHFLPGDEECLEKRILENADRSDMDNSTLFRLRGLGIVMPNLIPSSFNYKGDVITTKEDNTYALTTFGQKLADIILED